MNTSEKQEWSKPWNNCNAILIHMLPLFPSCARIHIHHTLTPLPQGSYKQSKINLSTLTSSLVRTGLILSLLLRFYLTDFSFQLSQSQICTMDYVTQVWKNSSAPFICVQSTRGQMPPSYLSARLIPNTSYPTVSTPTAPLHRAAIMHTCMCSTPQFQFKNTGTGNPMIMQSQDLVCSEQCSRWKEMAGRNAANQMKLLNHSSIGEVDSCFIRAICCFLHCASPLCIFNSFSLPESMV